MLDRLLARLESDFPVHLERVREWVRQPSISATGEGITGTVERLLGELVELRATARALPTSGHPVVIGELNAGRPVTVLLYGMYDVQPADEAGWTSPPFGAEIVDRPGIGPSLIGRGARNQKGPLAAMLNVLRAFRDEGIEPPVNLKFMIEGEEELGSPHVPGVLEQHRAELASDVVFFPLFDQTIHGTPQLHLGVKGLVYFELTARGGRWGGPRTRPIHSRNATWVGNPAWKLVEALASLSNSKGEVLIKGFYDDAIPPSERDLEVVRVLAGQIDVDAIRHETDSERFLWTESTEELVRKYCFQPTVNIDGISGGFMGDGTKTVIPHEVSAKLDFRLVPGMTPGRTLELLQRHLAQNGHSEIEVIVHSAYPAARTDPDEPAARALLRACEVPGKQQEVWPTLAGSAPFHVFQEILGAPFVMGGLGHAAGSHGPDEYCTVEGVKQLQLSIVRFLYYFAEEARAR